MAVAALDIARREPVLNGAAFGSAGAYEKITGRLRFAIDPSAPVHAAIADIELAPRNAGGLVESWADFYLLRPFGGGNRRLLLDVANRGRKVALGMFNSAPRTNDPTTPEDYGNGFLMRHGYTVAWVGWQHDVPRQDDLMALSVPRVPGVSGRVRSEFRPNSRTALGLHPRPPAPDAQLTVPGSTWRATAQRGPARALPGISDSRGWPLLEAEKPRRRKVETRACDNGARGGTVSASGSIVAGRVLCSTSSNRRPSRTICR